MKVLLLSEKIKYWWDDLSAALRKKIAVGAGGLCRNIKKLFARFTLRHSDSRLSTLLFLSILNRQSERSCHFLFLHYR